VQPDYQYGVKQDENPFKGPKLHLFKKGSRRLKTSSSTRDVAHQNNTNKAAEDPYLLNGNNKAIDQIA
jgi:hypothetical protein